MGAGRRRCPRARWRWPSRAPWPSRPPWPCRRPCWARL